MLVPRKRRSAGVSASRAARWSTLWHGSAGLPVLMHREEPVGYRRILNRDQIARLFDPPTDQRGLIRHYTLSAADIGMIRRGRGDHHRLGYALMLCYLRYPGRSLRAGEVPDPALVSFVADQVDVLPDSLGPYLASEQNRRRHSAALLNRLGLRAFGPRAANVLAAPNASIRKACLNARLDRAAGACAGDRD
jgi:hypothetical protein